MLPSGCPSGAVGIVRPWDPQAHNRHAAAVESAATELAVIADTSATIGRGWPTSPHRSWERRETTSSPPFTRPNGNCATPNAVSSGPPGRARIVARATRRRSTRKSGDGPWWRGRRSGEARRRIPAVAANQVAGTWLWILTIHPRQAGTMAGVSGISSGSVRAISCGRGDTLGSTMVPLDPSESDDLLELVDRQERSSGRPALSDQSRLALQHPGPDGPIVVTRRDGDGRLEAFAELSPDSVGWTLDVVSPAISSVTSDARAAGRPKRSASSPGRSTPTPRSPGGVTDPRRATPAWNSGSDSRCGANCSRCGASCRPGCRSRSPRDRSCRAPTRARSWRSTTGRSPVTMNRATGIVETLRLRAGEPWFDPDGFRLHERRRPPRRVLLDEDPSPTAIGEIYVIAVDPDFAGLGLGKQLTLAGLESLADARRGTRDAVRRRRQPHRRVALRAARLHDHTIEPGPRPTMFAAVSTPKRAREPHDRRRTNRPNSRGGALPTSSSRSRRDRSPTPWSARPPTSNASWRCSTSSASGRSTHARADAADGDAADRVLREFNRVVGRPRHRRGEHLRHGVDQLP